MYTTLIVWLIIVLVVIVVVLLSKNNIVRLLILASIICIFFTTFSQFTKSIDNTKIEKKISDKFVAKYDKLNLNQYKKTEDNKIEYKNKKYSVKEIMDILKIPSWMKPDLDTAKNNETLSEMLSKNSARAIVLSAYFLILSIIINVLFQIGYIIFKKFTIKQKK